MLGFIPRNLNPKAHLHWVWACFPKCKITLRTSLWSCAHHLVFSTQTRRSRGVFPIPLSCPIRFPISADPWPFLGIFTPHLFQSFCLFLKLHYHPCVPLWVVCGFLRDPLWPRFILSPVTAQGDHGSFFWSSFLVKPPLAAVPPGVGLLVTWMGTELEDLDCSHYQLLSTTSWFLLSNLQSLQLIYHVECIYRFPHVLTLFADGKDCLEHNWEQRGPSFLPIFSSQLAFPRQKELQMRPMTCDSFPLEVTLVIVKYFLQASLYSFLSSFKGMFLKFN